MSLLELPCWLGGRGSGASVKETGHRRKLKALYAENFRLRTGERLTGVGAVLLVVAFTSSLWDLYLAAQQLELKSQNVESDSANNSSSTQEGADSESWGEASGFVLHFARVLAIVLLAAALHNFKSQRRTLSILCHQVTRFLLISTTLSVHLGPPMSVETMGLQNVLLLFWVVAVFPDIRERLFWLLVHTASILMMGLTFELSGDECEPAEIYEVIHGVKFSMFGLTGQAPPLLFPRMGLLAFAAVQAFLLIQADLYEMRKWLWRLARKICGDTNKLHAPPSVADEFVCLPEQLLDMVGTIPKVSKSDNHAGFQTKRIRIVEPVARRHSSGDLTVRIPSLSKGVKRERRFHTADLRQKPSKGFDLWDPYYPEHQWRKEAYAAIKEHAAMERRLDRFRKSTAEIKHVRKVNELGMGDCSAVFTVSDAEMYRTYAFKTMKIPTDVQQKEDLLQEIELITRFSHPHIVGYRGRAQMRVMGPGYLLELCKQGSLQQLLQSSGCLDERTAACFTSDILFGLAHLHRHRVIHRDIKPANLLLHNGRVKIGDLGSARFCDSKDKVLEPDMAGFMAPEAANEQYGRKIDIWSVGCVVLAMFCLETLTDHEEGVVEEVCRFWASRSTPSLPSWLPKSTKSFLASCLQIDPARRPTALSLQKHEFIFSVLQSPRPYRLSPDVERALRMNLVRISTIEVSSSRSRARRSQNIFARLLDCIDEMEGCFTRPELEAQFHESFCELRLKSSRNLGVWFVPVSALLNLCDWCRRAHEQPWVVAIGVLIHIGAFLLNSWKFRDHKFFAFRIYRPTISVLAPILALAPTPHPLLCTCYFAAFGVACYASSMGLAMTALVLGTILVGGLVPHGMKIACVVFGWALEGLRLDVPAMKPHQSLEDGLKALEAAFAQAAVMVLSYWMCLYGYWVYRYEERVAFLALARSRRNGRRVTGG